MHDFNDSGHCTDMILAKGHDEFKRGTVIYFDSILRHASDCNLVTCFDIADEVNSSTLYYLL